MEEQEIVRVWNGGGEADTPRGGVPECVEACVSLARLERGELHAAHDPEADGTSGGFLELARDQGLVPQVCGDLEELPRQDIEGRLVKVGHIGFVDGQASNDEENQSDDHKSGLPVGHRSGRHPRSP